MEEMTTLEILQKARELILDPSRWIKGSYAGWRASDGTLYRELKPSADVANCWCSVGSCVKIYGNRDGRPAPLLKNALEALNNAASEVSYGEYAFAYMFNDAEETTHSQVLKMFDRAIELAKEETCCN